MGVPGIDWGQVAQMGVGGTALLLLGYLGGKVIDAFGNKGAEQKDEMKQVIENNTAATQTLISFLQVTLTKNETCMEQVVKNVEHIPGMAQQVKSIWDVVSQQSR